MSSMLQDLPLPDPGSKSFTPGPSLASSPSSTCGHSPNPQNNVVGPVRRDRLPPTPESIAADVRSTLPPVPHEPTNVAPPIKLSKRTWAKPQTLEINKLRLKEPKGIPDSTEAKSSKWAGTLKRVGDIYTYTRLPSTQIRLLLLKPGAFEDDVYVSLVTVEDTSAGGEDWPYCALSYHWGEGPYNNTVFVQEDASSRTLRTVEDVVDAKRPKKFKIKPNLYEALKILRHEKDVVSLWVDALCINQFDEEEKNEQVGKMALIYSRAYNVSIWLGSDHDEIDSPVSDLAMTFIPKVINPNLHARLLREECFVKSWASLFELLRWSWFSRRWVIQELALAQNATVHCGKHACLWSEFRTAIAIFDRYFDELKPKLINYFENTHPDRWSWDDDSMFRIKHLGAKLLVDVTSHLFRSTGGGSRASTRGLESLVCTLSGFDTSDPRDTINALRNISRELNRPDSAVAKRVPVPDYGKDLFEVYRDFVEWVVTTSKSLDILCRFWALKERTTKTPTTPRLVELPTWIQFAEDSAWGKGEDVFNGRQAGDSFVGLPDRHSYDASGQGASYREPQVRFPGSHSSHQDTSSDVAYYPSANRDMSITVRGVRIGKVRFHTDPFPDGIITKECLERLGWSLDKNAKTVPEVPAQVWQSLVADRDPDGKAMPAWYESACQSVLAHQSNNGHINIDKIIKRSQKKGLSSTVADYLRRVKGVTWNRSFIQGETCNKDDQFVGFAPPRTVDGDIVVILFGCSVPVILRPLGNGPDALGEHEFVGEAYIHGKMDGEALEECFSEEDFKII